MDALPLIMCMDYYLLVIFLAFYALIKVEAFNWNI